jgi:translocation and assembly module TamB
VNRVSRWVLGALLAACALLLAGFALLDTSFGHRFVVDRIAALKPANGLRFAIGRIDGSIYGRMTLVNVRVRDPRGIVFVAPRAQLDWRPFAWARNRLDIRSLVIPRATLARLPQTLPTGRTGPILPGFDIHIGALRVDNLTLSAPVTGVTRRAKLVGRADVRAGRAFVDLAGVVDGSDRLRLRLDAEPDRDRFDIDLRASGAADGLLARLSGIARPLAIEVQGDGRWRRWQGTVRAIAGRAQVADLALGVDAGRYTLGGTLDVQSLTRGKLQRLTAPRIRVNGGATLVDRQLDGTLALRSAALTVDAAGRIDLATSRLRDVRLAARLLRPRALFANMTGRDIAMRAILDGPFDTARFDYRITAARFAFDATGFDCARASGRGRLSRSPVSVPVAFTAQRVTGVGEVAGGILRNLSVAGVLKVTATSITGNDLILRSDKLNGRVGLILDLRTGRYEVGLTGGLRRYLIPGVGLVDVDSRLTVVPGGQGRGTRVVGTGTANVVRLDNSFFASLTGGLPRIVTDLERGPDRVLYFRNLRLTSPLLRLQGNGYRRTDGTFFFEGSGTQARYGPLTLRLDGRIDRPRIDLVLARPNEALGLRAVRAHLESTANGFSFTAAGGSRLGDFTGNGAILLPRGGQARILVAQLNVAGTRASGALDVVQGGFAGSVEVNGGGLTGRVAFRPQGELQRIDIDLEARNARLAEALTVRRASLEASVLLDPAGTTVDATITAAGLRRGSLALGRLTANAKLVGGVGQVRASFAGSRGRAFSINSEIDVAADSYTVRANGTVDRRELRLVSPAVIVREAESWRVQPTRIAFSGGEARVSGRFGAAIEIDASLVRMPLSVLDIGYPGLGLGGSASGSLRYADAGGAPTGRIDMTVRGLSRSGLVLSSRPIDVGIAGVLDPGKAAVRAIMASGGQTIGRGQALLRPLASGGLAQRLSNAGLFAQLRYAGPADTLWRLTGIELFDLSGPVAIGADVSGTLNDPRIRGSVRTNGARIESAVSGTVLRNVVASGRFGGSRLVLDSFSGQDSGSGRVSGSGSFDLSAANGFGIDLQVEAQNARLIARDDIAATVSGPLRFRSDGNGGTISGDVRVDSGRYRLGRAVQAAAVPRLNIREVNRRGGDDEDDRPPDPWRLDLRARGNLDVEGLGLDSQWAANLQIGGEPTNPRITGRLDLVRGTYEFAGRDFQLERGNIRFDGSVPANPSLDIAANADSTGLNATIRVTGFAEKLEIGFTSVPALPEDELLSRLLFGASITRLSAPEALQLAAAVAALNDPSGGLNPINAVRRAAGLDRLRILPADPQTGAGTAIAAGKYVTRRTYVEIISDAQGYSATRVEFQVTRWLSLLSTISTIGRQSANVRVSRDY